MAKSSSLDYIDDDRDEEVFSADVNRITIEDPSDGRKIWSQIPTFYNWCLSKEREGIEPWRILKHLHEQYANGTIRNLDDLKERLPQETTSLIHGVELQFQRMQREGATECWLFLGNCLQYQHNMTNALCTQKYADSAQREVLTLLIVGAILEEIGSTIGLDVRKDCWKNNTNANQDSIEGKSTDLDDDDTHRPNHSGCQYIDEKELTYLLWATRLEILVANKHYGITWKGC